MLENKLYKIALKSALLSKQFFLGNFTSLFKGNGINFKELREYQLGDDIKSINWVATARYSKALVKINEEERQHHIVFLIDVSKSVEFGTTTKTKKELIAEICFLIAYSSYQNNDKIGAIFFSNRIEKVIPLSNNNNNISVIAKNLINFEAISIGTDYSSVLTYLTVNFPKHSIVFIISDFISEINYEKELSIAAKKFTIIPIKISDPSENNNNKLELRSTLIKILDKEDNVITIINSKELEQIKKEKEMKEKYFSEVLKKYRIRYINIEINNNYIIKLKDFFQKYSYM